MERPYEDWPERVDRWRDRATLILVLSGAFGIAVVFQRDPSDMFRLPKTILYRAEAILLLAVTLAALLAGARFPRPNWRDPAVSLPLGAFAIFIVLTRASTNRPLSVDALASAAATLVIFFATVAVARRHGWILLGVPLAAAVINAVLVVVEETHLWMPFGVQPGIRHHLQCTALIGNPNEIGSYLGAAVLGCLAAILAREAGNRWTIRNVVIAIVISAGLVASQTLTAFIAVAAGVFISFAMSSWKAAIRVAIAGAIVAVIIVSVITPFRTRAQRLALGIKGGHYNAIFTERFTAFAAAWAMFLERPVTGVGPGVFAWHYYDQKIAAEQQYPSLQRVYNRGINFGEVHNDHLQALAEGGLAGYAAFAILLVALARISFTTPADAPDGRRRFVRHLAVSLAVFWAVLSLAQFPLETTVVRSLLIHLSALCAGWRSA